MTDIISSKTGLEQDGTEKNRRKLFFSGTAKVSKIVGAGNYCSPKQAVFM